MQVLPFCIGFASNKKDMHESIRALAEVEVIFEKHQFLSVEAVASILVIANVRSRIGIFGAGISSISLTDPFQAYVYNWLLVNLFYEGCSRGLFKLPGVANAPVTMTEENLANKMSAAKAKLVTLAAIIGNEPNLDSHFFPRVLS